MQDKSDLVWENNKWMKWIVRVAFLVWTVILLSYFFWSQFRFFADRLKPILSLIGL